MGSATYGGCSVTDYQPAATHPGPTPSPRGCSPPVRSLESRTPIFAWFEGTFEYIHRYAPYGLTQRTSGSWRR